MEWSWSGSSMMDLKASRASTVTFRLPTTSLLSCTSTTRERGREREKERKKQNKVDLSHLYGLKHKYTQTLTVQANIHHVSLLLQNVRDPKIGHTHILTLFFLLLLLRWVTHYREPDAETASTKKVVPLKLSN